MDVGIGPLILVKEISMTLIALSYLLNLKIHTRFVNFPIPVEIGPEI